MEAVLLDKPATAPKPAFKPDVQERAANGSSRFLRSEQEQTFYTRHAVAPSPKAVTFQFTRDPALLHQYYEMRARTFISVWGLKEFQGGKDEFDDVNDTLIASQGNLCVGGARFTIATPEMPSMLPLEKSGILVKDIFPELGLDNVIYGECSRFVLLPEFRTREVSQEMMRLVVQEHLRQKMAYGFWMAPLVVARSYRQTCVNLGYACKIRTDIEVPDREEYEGIKMYIGMMDFTKKLEPTETTSEVKSGQPEIA